MLHPNLKQLSHSSLVKLHKCPRKYELEKLTERTQDPEGDEHLIFGGCVGAGIQELMIHGDMNKAVMKMFTMWTNYIDDDTGERNKKMFWHVLYALDKFVLMQRTVLNNFKLAYFEGKPAVELGYKIDCGDGFSMRGFIDYVAIDSMRQEIIVFESKTTKFRNIHEAVFKHSGQGLGYSLIMDILVQILGRELTSSYKVNYLVYKTLSYEWELFPFLKSHTSRALWIKQILTDIQHIREYGEDGYFPMHGESCYDFFRPCQFFGICELSNSSIVPVVKERVESDNKYQFHFNLEQIIDSQLAKHMEVAVPAITNNSSAKEAA